MTLTAERLAPRVIALAVVGYCVWPSIAQFVDPPDVKPPQKPSELAAALLRPAVSPPPVRDPFGLTRKAPANAGSARAEEAGNLPPQGKNGRAEQAGNLLHPIHRNAGPLAGLTLEATCIVGERRLAMINGRFYAPRETIPASTEPAGAYKVLDVFPYRVLLECQGKEVELGYSDVASGSASGPRGSAPGPSGRAAKQPQDSPGRSGPDGSSQPVKAGR